MQPRCVSIVRRRAERRSIKGTHPTFLHERDYWSRGHECIAGVDEVGRGALAGPVLAAACVLPPAFSIEVRATVVNAGNKTSLPQGLRDSKQLTDRSRNRFFDELMNKDVPYGM